MAGVALNRALTRGFRDVRTQLMGALRGMRSAPSRVRDGVTISAFCINLGRVGVLRPVRRALRPSEHAREGLSPDSLVIA
jgi:hypothetical protein